ncbi:hypothetical protein [Alkalimarinus coralli]|uniref:hypothetical protein n=1 Tax=Alkalimarinus coralli TaxID=2935863 RepID=UPI00202B9EF7|nr:hypothetical protein [Alkalimarinus coralli]
MSIKLKGLEGEVSVKNITRQESWTFNENGTVMVPTGVMQGDEFQVTHAPDLQNCLFSGKYSSIIVDAASTIELSCENHLFFRVIQKVSETGYRTSLWVSDGTELKQINGYSGDINISRKNYHQINGFAYFPLYPSGLLKTDGSQEGGQKLTFPNINFISWLGQIDGLSKELLFLKAEDDNEDEHIYVFDVGTESIRKIAFSEGFDTSYFSANINESLTSHSFQNDFLTINERYKFPEITDSNNIVKLATKYLAYYASDGGYSNLTVVSKDQSIPNNNVQWPIAMGDVKDIAFATGTGDSVLVSFTEEFDGTDCLKIGRLTEQEEWQLVRDECNSADGFSYQIKKVSPKGAIAVRKGNGVSDIGIFNADTLEYTNIVPSSLIEGSIYEMSYYDDGFLISIGAKVETGNAPFSAKLQHTIYFYSYDSGQLSVIAEGKPANYTLFVPYPLDSMFWLQQDQDASILNLKFFVLPTEETGWELWVTDGTKLNTKALDDIKPGPKSGVQFLHQPYEGD